MTKFDDSYCISICKVRIFLVTITDNTIALSITDDVS